MKVKWIQDFEGIIRQHRHENFPFYMRYDSVFMLYELMCAFDVYTIKIVK